MKVRRVINGTEVSAEEFAAGGAERLAAMFAAGAPPMSNTDREFMEGRCNGNQFEKNPQIGDKLAQDAKAAGVSTKGKVYLSGLAAYPGDPRAWVGGRGDVQALCEERNWTASGSVTVKGDRSRPESNVKPPGDA